MRILGIESSSLVASVGVVTDGVLTAEYTVNFKKTHSQTLLPMLDEVARMIELDLHTVDAIAVSGGPGSFTGLRIGSATAKGLGLALKKPLIHVPTVDALAYNMWGYDGLVCPIMDARRNQVYTGLYRFRTEECVWKEQKQENSQAAEEKPDSSQTEGENPENTGSCKCLGGMEILKTQCPMDMRELAEELNQKGERVIFLGDGVPVCREIIREAVKVPFCFAPPHMNRQRAGAVAALGALYYKAGRTETAAEHGPDYLRKSQAERERSGETLYGDNGK